MPTRYLYLLPVYMLCLLLTTNSNAQEFLKFQEGSELSRVAALPQRYKVTNEQLSAGDQWKIRVYGIRMTPLDPQFWSIRKIDLTENRKLIPIRKFYLLPSEDPNFALQSVNFNIEFHNATRKYMERAWHSKDPIFTLGFAGNFNSAAIGEKPLLDHEYFLRLSAFPYADSGIYFRNGLEEKALCRPSQLQLEPRKQYEVELKLVDDHLQVILNQQPFCSIKGKNLKYGLVSIQASWHPVLISNLEIKALTNLPNGSTPITISGLIQNSPGSKHVS